MRRDVARDDRGAVRRRLEQRDRQSLEIRRLHERRGVRIQLGERVAKHVAGQHHAIVGRRGVNQGVGVRVGVARTTGEHELHVARQTVERADQAVGRLLGHEAADEE